MHSMLNNRETNYLSTSNFFNKWNPCLVLESSVCTANSSTTKEKLLHGSWDKNDDSSELQLKYVANIMIISESEISVPTKK